MLFIGETVDCDLKLTSFICLIGIGLIEITQIGESIDSNAPIVSDHIAEVLSKVIHVQL